MYVFQWDDSDYYRQYAETADPRLVLVIERDDDSCNAPDGDSYAPTYWYDNRGNLHAAGSTFDGDEVAEAFQQAKNFFGGSAGYGWSDPVARYLRIFHGAEYVEVSSHVHRDYSVVIFDTPEFRDHCGIPASMTSKDVLAGDVDAWQAYLDGEVYGVGYAVNVDRVSHDLPVDLDDFDVRIECWGFYGTEYAQEQAPEHTPNDIPELRQPFLPV